MVIKVIEKERGLASQQDGDGEKRVCICVPDLCSLYFPHPQLSAFMERVRGWMEAGPSVFVVCMIPEHRQDHWHWGLEEHVGDGAEVLQHLHVLHNFYDWMWRHRDRMEAVALGDVVGSYFELALCMKTLKVSSPFCVLGFPDWPQGFFPAGGVCELWEEHRGLKRGVWLTQSCLWAMHAPSVLGVQLVAAASARWLQESCEENEQSYSGHGVVHQRFVSAIPYLAMGDDGGAGELPPQLSGLQRLHPAKRGVHFEKFWDVFWKKTSSSEMVAQKHIQLWQMWKRVYRERGWTSWWDLVCPGVMEGWSRPLDHNYTTLYLDVSLAAPSLGCVLRWQRWGLQCVYVSDSAKSLAKHLQQLMQQYGAVYSKKDVHYKRLFESMIWLVLSVEEYQSLRSRSVQMPVVMWQQHHTLTVRYRQREYRYMSLSSHGGSAEGLPVAEVRELPPAWQQQEQEAFGCLLFRECIVTTSPRPLTSWLRERLRMLVHTEGALMKGGEREVLKILLRMGWHVWTQGDIDISQDQFQGAREKDDRTGLLGQDPRYRVRGVMADHLRMFAIFMMTFISQQGWVQSLHKADLLVREVYGVPAYEGSLWGLAQRRYGRMMLQEYAQRFFPEQGFSQAVEHCFSEGLRGPDEAEGREASRSV